MDISLDTSFFVEKRHSDKKNSDYYCVIMKIKDKEVILTFLSERQYNDIISALSN